MLRRFIWGKASNLVKWERVCTLKGEGGLGLLHIEDIRDANSLKLGWMVSSGREGLLRKWMKAKCVSLGPIWDAQLPLRCSYVWLSNWKMRLLLRDNLEEIPPEGFSDKKLSGTKSDINALPGLMVK